MRVAPSRICRRKYQARDLLDFDDIGGIAKREADFSLPLGAVSVVKFSWEGVRARVRGVREPDVGRLKVVIVDGRRRVSQHARGCGEVVNAGEHKAAQRSPGWPL